MATGSRLPARARIFVNKKTDRNPTGTDLWTVRYGPWQQSCASHGECMKALQDYMKHRVCLYHGCYAEGEYIDGMGYGFRFCSVHTAIAKKVLAARFVQPCQMRRRFNALGRI